MGPLLAVGGPHWHKEGPQRGAVLKICSLLVTPVPAWAMQPAHPGVCESPWASCGIQQFLWHSSCALLCPRVGVSLSVTETAESL